jgi:hypothetical protein
LNFIAGATFLLPQKKHKKTVHSIAGGFEDTVFAQPSTTSVESEFASKAPFGKDESPCLAMFGYYHP